MQRRDLSLLLTSTAIAAAAGTSTAQAQTCTTPCYPRTAAETAVGVTPTNTMFQQGDVRRYGADPTGVADSTTAVQTALNVNSDVYIPSGSYLITAFLTNAKAGRRVHGDGPKVSVLHPVGAINTLFNSASNVLLDNFGISGDSTTLDGITQPTGSSLWSSVLQNLIVTVGGRAFYFFDEFNTQFINCAGSSYDNNVFELAGSNTTRLSGCYAVNVPLGFYGYRIYCSAQMDSCNGINTPAGGDWGLFGANTAKGDPTTSDFAVTLTNCNIEDFNNYGLRFRGNGYAKISGGAVQAKASGTYQAEFYVEYTGQMVIIENVKVYNKGATRAKRAAVYADTNSYILIIGDTVAPVCDLSGTELVTLPCLQGSVPTTQDHNAIHITNLDVDHFFNRYAGTVTLAGGTASVSFVNSQFDAGYCVSLAGSANETFYVTGKTTNGFHIASSNPSSTASVDWVVVRPVTNPGYVQAS